MATARDESLPFRCFACKELFQVEPKVLPCSHVMCTCCLKDLLGRKEDATPRCPLCTEPIVSTKYYDRDEVVERLHTDFVLLELAKSSAQLSQRQVCSGCRGGTPVRICLDCGDKLCLACDTAHGNLAATRSHRVESLTSVTEEQLACSRSAKCSAHGNDVATFYCVDDKEVICQTCAITRHRNCRNLQELAQVLAETRDEITEVVEFAAGAEKRFEDAISELDRFENSTRKEIEAQLDEAVRGFEDIHTMLTEREAALRQAARKALTQLGRDVEAAQQELRGGQKNFAPIRIVAERAARVPLCAFTNDVAYSLKTRQEELIEKIELWSNTNKVSFFSLMVDQDALLEIKEGLKEMLSNAGDLNSTPVSLTSQPMYWRFHQNHGKNITLRADGSIAERVAGTQNAAVISDQPMIQNMLYQVSVEKTDDYHSPECQVKVGVVINDTPEDLLFGIEDDLHNLGSAVLLGCADVIDKHQRCPVTETYTRSAVGSALVSLEEGGSFGVMLNSYGNLKVYVNNAYVGVAAKRVASPCYAYFFLGYPVKQVKCLRLETIL